MDRSRARKKAGGIYLLDRDESLDAWPTWFRPPPGVDADAEQCRATPPNLIDPPFVPESGRTDGDACPPSSVHRLYFPPVAARPEEAGAPINVEHLNIGAPDQVRTALSSMGRFYLRDGRGARATPGALSWQVGHQDVGDESLASDPKVKCEEHARADQAHPSFSPGRRLHLGWEHFPSTAFRARLPFQLHNHKP